MTDDQPLADLQERDGRPAVRFDRRLAHPAEAVFAALSTTEGLAAWFPARVELEPREGGTVTFSFEGSGDPPSHGRVLVWDPPRHLAFTWEDSEMRFALEPDDGGCRLIFTHVLADQGTASRDAAGWEVCLGYLARSLGGDRTPPEFGPTPEWREAAERYEEEFGIPVAAPPA